MDFILFTLLNATLLLRPAEIWSDLQAWPIYQIVILACLGVAHQRVFRELDAGSLFQQPISICVIGVSLAIPMSHIAQLSFWDARMAGFEFFKVAIYYFLLIGIIDTVARLESFLRLIVCLTTTVALITLLNHYGYISLEALKALEEVDYDDVTGERIIVVRLQGAGIFHDPNDLCLILSLALAPCFYFLTNPQGGLCRIFWLLPIAVCSGTLVLTQSRGGFLSLLAGLGAFLVARHGLWKSVPLGALAVPALLVVFGGRQTSIASAMSTDTGQSRIQLWSEGLQCFKSGPLFGIGADRYAEEVGQVAHNSFIHCFTELGFFGGAFFLGAFTIAIATLFNLKSIERRLPGDRLLRLRPFLLAGVVAYATGVMALSRAYVVPTYLTLGIAAAYFRLVNQRLPRSAPRWDGALIQRLMVVSVLFLGAVYLFVRALGRWS